MAITNPKNLILTDTEVTAKVVDASSSHVYATSNKVVFGSVSVVASKATEVTALISWGIDPEDAGVMLYGGAIYG